TDFAAPAFDERDRQMIGPELPRLDPHRALRELVELGAEKVDRALDLQPADVGAGEDVARGPGGDGDVSETVVAGGMGLAHVALQTAGPARDAHEAELPSDAVVDTPGVLKPRHHGGRVPE